ncbi:SET domain-containing protein, partial [Wuchereria bancrofti]
MECFCGSKNCRRIIGRKANTTRKASVKDLSVLNEHVNDNNNTAGNVQSRTIQFKSFNE